MLDYLYLVGDVAIAGRTSQFEVLYDLPERVLPAAVLDAPTPAPQDAVTELVRRAARSHGVASAQCLADYYRLRLQPAPGAPSVRVAVERLVELGELELHRANPLYHVAALDVSCYDREYAPAEERAEARRRHLAAGRGGRRDQGRGEPGACLIAAAPTRPR